MALKLTELERAEVRVSEARSDLVRSHPFFGILSYNLILKPMSSALKARALGPVCTDQISIIYDPAWVNSRITVQDVKFVLAHEVLHCALLHCTRRQRLLQQLNIGRDTVADRMLTERIAIVWNIACDYVVNWCLVQSSFTLPPTVLQCPVEFRDMDVETIFWILWKMVPPPPIIEIDVLSYGEESDLPSGGDRTGMEELARADLKQTQANSAAMVISKGRGSVPAFLQRSLDKLTQPRIDWHSQLHRFMKRLIPSGLTWARPARRMIHTGMYLPSRRRVLRMGTMIIGVDTSASVNPALLNAFCAELTGAVGQAQPDLTYVLWSDAAINKVQVFRAGERLVLEPGGGGGTDFIPVFNWVAQQNLRPACLIYLSDLDGTFPDEAPPYPVLWVCPECPELTFLPRAPFGETIYLDY